MIPLPKYPRTFHLEGSKGTHEAGQIPLANLVGSWVVVEEKLDGASCSFAFSSSGTLGVFHRDAPVERLGASGASYGLLKAWAQARAYRLWDVLGERYVVYVEWCYAKHTIFYDALDHYLFESDVWDRQEKRFLSTSERKELLHSLSMPQVPVLFAGVLRQEGDLLGLVGPSRYRSSNWRDALRAICSAAGESWNKVLRETEPTEGMEGLYVKVEGVRGVEGRYKWIRPEFLETLLASNSHWRDRNLIPNQLRPGVDFYGLD